MRIIRTFLWLICILALLAIGSVVTLYFLITPETVQTRLQSSLDQIGLSIRANETARVKVLPTISVNLPSAQVFDKENKLVAFYRSAHFEVSPWWLLLGQVHVKNLLIDGFSLQERELATPSDWLKENITTKTALIDDLVIESVELNNSELRLKLGSNLINLQNLRAVVSDPAPQMHAPISLSTQMHVSPANVLMDLNAAFSLDLNLASGKISLENLSVQSTGTHEGKPFQLNLNSPLAQITAQDFYAQTASATLSGSPSFGNLSLSAAELRIDEKLLQAPDIYLNFVKGVAADSLSFEIRSPFSFNRETNESLADHLQGSVTLPGQSEKIPLSGKVAVNWDKQSVESELFASIHAAPTTFKGRSAGFDHPAIEGDLVFGRLELTDLSFLKSLYLAKEDLPGVENTSTGSPNNEESAPAGQAPETDTTAAQNKSEAAEENETLNGSSPIENESAVEQTQQSTDSTQTTEIASDLSAQSATPAPDDFNSDVLSHSFAFLNQFDFKGSVVVGELKAGPITLSQLKSDMVIQNGTLHLPKAIASTYGGKTELDLQLNDQGHWSVQYRGEGISLSPLLKDAAGNENMPGNLNLQASLYGNGFTQRTLNGQIGFAAVRTKLFGFDLNEAIKDIREFRNPTQQSDRFTEVEHLRGIATIHEGRADVERLSVDFGLLRMNGQAQIELADNQLAGELKGTGPHSLELTLGLTGQWQNPLLTLDAEKIRADNNLIAPQKPKEPESDKPSSWDKLKDFFREKF